jgi:hypothetical protein
MAVCIIMMQKPGSYPHFKKNIDNITIHILVLEKMAYVWRY